MIQSSDKGLDISSNRIRLSPNLTQTGESLYFIIWWLEKCRSHWEARLNMSKATRIWSYLCWSRMLAVTAPGF